MSDADSVGTCIECGRPLFLSHLGIVGVKYFHHDPYRLNCFLGEPWTTPKLSREVDYDKAKSNKDNIQEQGY
jgi:hypothetical protein